MTSRKPGRRYLSFLKLLSGLCWTLTYILIINRGFQDQTYGMPVLAWIFFGMAFVLALVLLSSIIKEGKLWGK